MYLYLEFFPIRLSDFLPYSMSGSRCCRHCLFLAVDQILLQDGEQVIDEPVKHQTRSEIDEHDGEDEREKHHYLCLGGIGCGWGHLLLQEHGRTHEQGKYGQSAKVWEIKAKVKAIRSGQVCYPEHKRCMAQLD